MNYCFIVIFESEIYVFPLKMQLVLTNENSNHPQQSQNSIRVLLCGHMRREYVAYSLWISLPIAAVTISIAQLHQTWTSSNINGLLLIVDFQWENSYVKESVCAPFSVSFLSLFSKHAFEHTGELNNLLNAVILTRYFTTKLNSFSHLNANAQSNSSL